MHLENSVKGQFMSTILLHYNSIFLHYILLTVHLLGANSNEFLIEVKTFTNWAGKRAESLAGSTAA